MKQLLIIVAVLLILPSALATTYHTTLLTVSEDDWQGGTADVYLEIKPGTGRIFMDSFPISKADTQFSTRFANEIACDFLKKNCDHHDFFYTIRAESTVVGGPSAGAALAVLTIAALDGQNLRQDVAMTGTINSGGQIGPVAGIVPKTKAASEQGITTVVVPALAELGLDKSINKTNVSNSEVTQNLSNGEFHVVEAADLYEALPYFLDKTYPLPTTELIIPESYRAIMENVTKILCERRAGLLLRTEEDDNRTAEINTNVDTALLENRFYSAASFCFSQNIELQEQHLESLHEVVLQERVKNVKRELVVISAYLDEQNLSTIGDVETLAIVRERAVEAIERLDGINESNISLSELAYVIERTYSARVWAEFFALESTPYTINDAYLRNACLNKISEAEERITYAEGFVPESFVASAREEVTFARRDLAREEYAVCLFKASKAKAEANLMTSVLAVPENRVDLLLEQKLLAVERVLSLQAEAGLFPIMGYSYYEYAQSLAEDEPYSALTFAEYALELSNLQLYFPREESFMEDFFAHINWQVLGVFLLGMIVGMIVWSLIKK